MEEQKNERNPFWRRLLEPAGKGSCFMEQVAPLSQAEARGTVISGFPRSILGTRCQDWRFRRNEEIAINLNDFLKQLHNISDMYVKGGKNDIYDSLTRDSSLFIDALSLLDRVLPASLIYKAKTEPNTSLAVLHSHTLLFAPPKEITECLLLPQVPPLVRTYFRLASHLYKSRDR